MKSPRLVKAKDAKFGKLYLLPKTERRNALVGYFVGVSPTQTPLFVHTDPLNQVQLLIRDISLNDLIEDVNPSLKKNGKA